MDALARFMEIDLARALLQRRLARLDSDREALLAEMEHQCGVTPAQVEMALIGGEGMELPIIGAKKTGVR